MTPQGPNSVTGFNIDSSDANSLWAVVEEYPHSKKTYKDSVKCGDTIMLQHSLTQGRLRTAGRGVRLVTDKYQFVSSTRGEPDATNNWKIECVGKEVGEPFMYEN